MSNFIINSDKDPFVVDRDSILKHNKMGLIPFDLSRVGLHQAKAWHAIL